MFENRITANGSAYLAETLFTDIRPILRQKCRHSYLKSHACDCSYKRVFDALNMPEDISKSSLTHISR